MAKRPTMNATFGPFSLSYPHLSKPDDKFGEASYRADGVEDPNSKAMKDAKALLTKACKEFGLDPKTVKLPLVRETMRDPNAPEGQKKAKRVDTGKLLLKAKSKRAPTLVDARCQTIDPAKVEIGGGSIAIVQGFLAPYEMRGDEGVSFTLTGVQVIKLQERAGRAEFAVYEGEDAFSISDSDAFTPKNDDGEELSIGSDSDDADSEISTGTDDGGLLDV